MKQIIVIFIFSSLFFLSCKNSVNDPIDEVKIVSKNSYRVCVNHSLTIDAILSDSSGQQLKWEILSGVGAIYSSGYFNAPRKIETDSTITTVRVSLQKNSKIYRDIEITVLSNPYNTFEVIKDYRGKPMGSIELETGEYLTYGSAEINKKFKFILWKHDAKGKEIGKRFIPRYNGNTHMGGESYGIYLSPTKEIWIYSYDLSEDKYPAYLAKIDNHLNVTMDMSFQNKKINCMEVSNNGDIFLGGDSSNYSWVAKLNKNLELQWSKTDKGSQRSEITSLTLCDDNSIALVGNFHKSFFWKIDNGGAELVRVNITGDHSAVSSITKKANHFLIHGKHPQLNEVDENGKNVWTRDFFNDGNWFSRNIFKTKDGNYVVNGWTSSSLSNGGLDGYLIKVNQDGIDVFSKSYGSRYEDYLYHVLETSDGGFLLSMHIHGKAALIKTDNIGRITCPCNCY